MPRSDHRVRARRELAGTGLSLGMVTLYVGLAGAAGGVLRLIISVLAQEQFMKFPWATLMINVIGSALLGLVVGLAAAWPQLPRWTLPVIGTGLLGSFTTFSTVMLLAVASQHGALFPVTSGENAVAAALPEMVAYLVMSMLFCTAAATAGVTVGKALFGCSGMNCSHAQPAAQPPVSDGETGESAGESDDR